MVDPQGLAEQSVREFQAFRPYRPAVAFGVIGPGPVVEGVVEQEFPRPPRGAFLQECGPGEEKFSGVWNIDLQVHLPRSRRKRNRQAGCLRLPGQVDILSEPEMLVVLIVTFEKKGSLPPLFPLKPRGELIAGSGIFQQGKPGEDKADLLRPLPERLRTVDAQHFPGGSASNRIRRDAGGNCADQDAGSGVFPRTIRERMLKDDLFRKFPRRFLRR